MSRSAHAGPPVGLKPDLGRYTASRAAFSDLTSPPSSQRDVGAEWRVYDRNTGKSLPAACEAHAMAAAYVLNGLPDGAGPLKALLGLGVCDCEHHSHAPGAGGHASCADAVGIEPIRTVYGTFHVCDECRAAHPYPAEFLAPSEAEVPDDASAGRVGRVVWRGTCDYCETPDQELHQAPEPLDADVCAGCYRAAEDRARRALERRP